MSKKIVNEYEIQLGPVDPLGLKWVENLIRFIKMGAEVKKDSMVKVSFPHYAWLTISTDEVLKSEPGVQVHRVNETFTKEQLEEMTWQEFRAQCEYKGVRGRDRAQMTRAYLTVTGQDPDAISKNKVVPKGGFVEEASEGAVENPTKTKGKRQQKKQEHSPEKPSSEESLDASGEKDSSTVENIQEKE